MKIQLLAVISLFQAAAVSGLAVPKSQTPYFGKGKFVSPTTDSKHNIPDTVSTRSSNKEAQTPDHFLYGRLEKGANLNMEEGGAGLDIAATKEQAVLPAGMAQIDTQFDPIDGIWPVYPKLELVQGGGTVYTFKLPAWTDRVMYFLKTNGRPLKAEIEIWVGPIRRLHRVEIDSEDGNLTPYMGTINFKKLAPVLKIKTKEAFEFPLLCGVFVPSPSRSKEMSAQFKHKFYNALPGQKQICQGGHIQGGGGSVRYWKIPHYVKSVQILGWSTDVGKKSFRCKVEVLQGPNTKKQSYSFQCGGSTQPYHVIMETPGQGSVIRIHNLKFLEDGLFEMAVIPYELEPEATASGNAPPATEINLPMHDGIRTNIPLTKNNVNNGERWWEPSSKP